MTCSKGTKIEIGHNNVPFKEEMGIIEKLQQFINSSTNRPVVNALISSSLDE